MDRLPACVALVLLFLCTGKPNYRDCGVPALKSPFAPKYFDCGEANHVSSTHKYIDACRLSTPSRNSSPRGHAGGCRPQTEVSREPCRAVPCDRLCRGAAVSAQPLCEILRREG